MSKNIRAIFAGLIPMGLMLLVICSFPLAAALVAGWQIGTWSRAFGEWYTS